MFDNNELIVTIRCLAYNHEPYIRQCLDGFVMQKTNFRFEAVVHDDASTDGTAAIIREYAERYPDIIKPIYETENQYSKRDGSLSRVLDAHMQGKYIAICEGDDYWTDPYKLQKQVDFLEANPEYSMCFANAVIHWEDGFMEDSLFSAIENREYTSLEIHKQWIIPTATICYRNSDEFVKMQNSVSKNKNIIICDLVYCMILAKIGKIYGFSDVVSVYRKHLGGVTNIGGNIEQLLRLAKFREALVDVFGKEYKKDANIIASQYYWSAFVFSIKNAKKQG